MHRYNPYNAGTSSISSRHGRSQKEGKIRGQDQTGEAEEPSLGKETAEASEDKVEGGRKKRGPVSETVLEHRLALHQVDIGTSGTLAFATTLDHALRCKT